MIPLDAKHAGKAIVEAIVGDKQNVKSAFLKSLLTLIALLTDNTLHLQCSARQFRAN